MRSGLCSGAAGGVASRSVRSVKGLLWGCGSPCAEAVGGGVERLGVSIRVSWQDHSLGSVCLSRSGAGTVIRRSIDRFWMTALLSVENANGVPKVQCADNQWCIREHIEVECQKIRHPVSNFLTSRAFRKNPYFCTLSRIVFTYEEYPQLLHHRAHRPW